MKSEILLLDILEMIDRIEYYTEKVGMNFNNLVYYDSTLMRLQVIGESVKRLPKEGLKKYSEVDWNVFIKFREVVSHTYFRVSHKILNDMIRNQLPKLKHAIKDMNRRLK